MRGTITSQAVHEDDNISVVEVRDRGRTGDQSGLSAFGSPSNYVFVLAVVKLCPMRDMV